MYYEAIEILYPSISVAFFFWSEKVYTFLIGTSGLLGFLYGVL